VVNLAPGDPTALYFQQGVPPEILEQIRRNFGLDQPIHIRTGGGWWRSSPGDFGYSYAQPGP
jgi:peptide/nickel transport system permease protein